MLSNFLLRHFFSGRRTCCTVISCLDHEMGLFSTDEGSAAERHGNYLNMKSLLVTVCSWVCPDHAVWSGVIKTYFFPNNDFSELALSSYFTLWLQPLPSDQVVSVKTCCCLRKLSQLCICMTKTLLRTSTNSLSCMSYINSKLKKKES